MSCQVGYLNCSLSYLSNLQRQSSRISLSYLTSSPLPSLNNNSPRIGSDDSTNTVYNTISQFFISDIDTSDKFQISDSSPPTFSQTLPTSQNQTPEEIFSALSYNTGATRIYSTLMNDQRDPCSPVTEN